MVVAIDGPAGVGKSTIAKMIAEKNNFFYLNSGNFYRALTYEALQNNMDLGDEEALKKFVNKFELTIENGNLHSNGIDIEVFLHSDHVDKNVAPVSSHLFVREYVNDQIRKVSHSLDIVVEGRDMTTVVFPDAEVKIYFDARPEIRAQRRFDQGVSSLSYEEILESIKERDHIDRTKKYGGLKIAGDAFYLDTSDLTIDAVCEKVTAIIADKKKK